MLGVLKTTTHVMTPKFGKKGRFSKVSPQVADFHQCTTMTMIVKFN